jgi:hypothetical protein
MKTKRAYLARFQTTVRAKALETALDIRKFEIELYWKRATYFWTIIGVAFAGYFALGKDGPKDSQIMVACLGWVFSTGWYMVNRGSAAWQRNWEIHVDLLEDAEIGPLHKTYVRREPYRVTDLFAPYGFSPSRINAILSLTVVLAWMGLIVGHLAPWTIPCLNPKWAPPLFAVAAVIALGLWGRSATNKTDEPLHFDPRSYK